MCAGTACGLDQGQHTATRDRRRKDERQESGTLLSSDLLRLAHQLRPNLIPTQDNNYRPLSYRIGKSPRQCNHPPVSYTHLDVYKRQYLLRTTTPPPFLPDWKIPTPMPPSPRDPLRQAKPQVRPNTPPSLVTTTYSSCCHSHTRPKTKTR